MEANSHPFRVTKVADEGFYANSHPYKVVIVGGGGQEGRVVDELPEVGETGYIYLVLKETTEEGDIYDEYMWVLQRDGETYGWEHIGTTNEVTIRPYNAAWLKNQAQWTEENYLALVDAVQSEVLITAPANSSVNANTTDYAVVVTKDTGSNPPANITLEMGSGTTYIATITYPVGATPIVEVTSVYPNHLKVFSATENQRLDQSPTGIYRNDTSANMMVYGGSNIASSRIVLFPSAMALVLQEGGNVATILYQVDGGGEFVYAYNVGGTYTSEGRLVGRNNIANDLTTTVLNKVLDARQGKVLDDKIGGDLSNLDTTDKSSLINAINELVASSGGGTTETITVASTDWSTLSSSSPYDNQATVTITSTITGGSIVELINDLSKQQ